MEKVFTPSFESISYETNVQAIKLDGFFAFEGALTSEFLLIVERDVKKFVSGINFNLLGVYMLIGNFI